MLPLLGEHDDVGAEIERLIDPVAFAAKQGDITARNQLYAVFGTKITRFARRIHAPDAIPGGEAAWGHDDVHQETFLVFLALIERWPTAFPFARYFFAHYPWRLRDAIYRGIADRGVPPRCAVCALDETIGLADPSCVDDEHWADLEGIAAVLPPLQGEVLRRHVGAGRTLTEVARELGLGRRTVNRYWAAIRFALSTPE